MAIEWGAWEGGSPNRIRVGIDVSWEAVSHGEGAATATVKIYVDVEGNWSDTQTLSFGGSIGGSLTFSNNQNNNQVLRETKSYTYNYGANEYGSSPGSRTFSASLSGAFNGATPSKSVTSSIPKRPYASPLAPTNVGVSRVSDTSQKITWTNRDTSGEPWDRVRVQYDVLANDAWNGDVGVPGGGSTSFTDSGTTVANQKYRYRVRSENSVGDSAWVETAVIYTTPAAPSSASRGGTVTAPVVSWVNNAGYGEYNTEVWRSVNGVWSLLTTKTAGITSHTDAVSAADKVKYKVRHKTTTGAQGTLYSAYSGETTETPGITAPPNAPINLNPNSINVDPTLQQVWSWSFQATVGGDTQQAFELRHRLVGTTDWTTVGPTTTATQSYTMPANTYPEQVAVEWQVRTKGSDPTYSPWSEPVSFTTSVAAIAPDPVKIPMVLDLFTGRMEASTTAYELRNMVMRIQSNLMGGGVRTVSSSYAISWSQRFIAIALGRSPNTFPNGHHDIVNPHGWTVTNKVLNANKATLTFSAFNGVNARIRVGDTITVVGVGSPFDGQWTAREVTTNTVSFDVVAPNVASSAATGGVHCTIKGHGGANDTTTSGGTLTLGSWQALYYELPFGWGAGDTPRKNGVVRISGNYSLTSNVATIPVVSPHYFAVGDRVFISGLTGAGAVLNGERTITAMTMNSISFALTNANIAATAADAGALVKPSGKDTFYSNFHVVTYTSDFVVPDNWILIALRNNDASTVEWGTGDTVDPGYDSDSPVFKQAIFTSTSDASNASGNKPAIRIGSPTSTHVRMDNNELQAMADDNTVGNYNINIGGGGVNLAHVDGISEFRGTVEFPHAPTTTAGANCNLNASLDNRMRLVTSLAKWKLQQEGITEEEASGLLNVVPKTWFDVTEVEENGGSTEGLRRIPGFIAEDMHEHAPIWATYTTDGELNGVAYDRISAGVLVLVQQQARELAELRARLEELEGGAAGTLS
jgi:hypothetical protein